MMVWKGPLPPAWVVFLIILLKELLDAFLQWWLVRRSSTLSIGHHLVISNGPDSL